MIYKYLNKWINVCMCCIKDVGDCVHCTYTKLLDNENGQKFLNKISLSENHTVSVESDDCDAAKFSEVDESNQIKALSFYKLQLITVLFLYSSPLIKLIKSKPKMKLASSPLLIPKW